MAYMILRTIPYLHPYPYTIYPYRGPLKGSHGAKADLGRTAEGGEGQAPGRQEVPWLRLPRLPSGGLGKS